ncbi:MAG: bifunctional hydroxymethylpyrimidine kinase/phosphomethylpyrimidine kinase [Desulfatiglans sp.]|jgi:hydroxymethylpyrimidine/phosphomethylpyrimidine kinase|nr:bifunctional hydroxymethylpyrimidine kinase/phosphomethylpyrimidine kinase [Desulfatiglans sp.]
MTTDKSDRKEKKNYYRSLTIAGSDSGGGAGIQADLKTFAAIGCYGMSVITALTAQNTQGVTGIYPVPPSFVEQQIEALFTDIGTDAVKIGMLFSSDHIEVVARQLTRFKAQNIVLDPVMVAQSGDRLLKDDAVEAIKAHLLPIADIVTPNLPEAAVMLGREINTVKEMEAAARDLSHYGGRYIMIKGGHLEADKSTDLFYSSREDRSQVLHGHYTETDNNHGTGCTLSSAIAGYLAQGLDMESAVKNAKSYITEAIRVGAEYSIGRGHGPVHHFFKYW